MGMLTPGAAYVYEREGGRTYARKIGEVDRVLIGEDYHVVAERQREEIAKTWVPIVQAAEHNAALQTALDHARMLYELGRSHEPEHIMHHPV